MNGEVMSLWSNSVLKLLAAVVFLDFLAEQMRPDVLIGFSRCGVHNKVP